MAEPIPEAGHLPHHECPADRPAIHFRPGTTPLCRIFDQTAGIRMTLEIKRAFHGDGETGESGSFTLFHGLRW
jgi:hypothetical protein